LNSLRKKQMKIISSKYYLRARNLPEEEQGPFNEWLVGQTRPWLEWVPDEEQDGYYAWDYDDWKRSLRGEYVPWD
jgi:hypothetical protein